MLLLGAGYFLLVAFFIGAFMLSRRADDQAQSWEHNRRVSLADNKVAEMPTTEQVGEVRTVPNARVEAPARRRKAQLHGS
ncbi:hypothetical protein BH688_14835 [Kushneria phosphatilytica]|nr:hypothetical protein BH688_14835 [Kushneria phosphatilytica]